jgi:hypothetical protein
MLYVEQFKLQTNPGDRANGIPAQVVASLLHISLIAWIPRRLDIIG